MPQNPYSTPQTTDRQVTLDEFDDMVRQKYGIPTGLWKGMAEQESGGDWNAVSPTGVRGKYQVTKATAAQYGLNRDDPWDQTVAAAKHLRAQYDALGTIKNDRERWLGAVGRYYGGDNAVGQDGSISGKSPDGISNPVAHIDRVARNWAQYENGTSSQPATTAQPAAPRPARPTPKPPVPLTDPATGRGVSNPFDYKTPLTQTIAESTQRRQNYEQTPVVPEVRPRGISASRQQAVEQERARFQGRNPIARYVESTLTSDLSRAAEFGQPGLITPAAKEDLRLKRIAQGLPEPQAPQGAQEVLGRFTRGAANVLATAPEGAAEIIDAAVSRLPRNPAQFGAPSKGIKLAPYARPLTDAVQRGADVAAPVNPNNQSFLTNVLPQAAGSAAGFGVSAALSPGGAGRRAAGYLGAATNAQQIAREYDQATVGRPELQNDEARRAQAVIAGAGAGATEALGLGGRMGEMADRILTDGSFRKLVAGIAEEAGQEYGQDYLNDIIAKYIGAYDPQRSLHPLEAGKLQSALAGAILGGVFGGAEMAHARTSPEFQQQRAARANIADAGAQMAQQRQGLADLVARQVQPTAVPTGGVAQPPTATMQRGDTASAVALLRGNTPAASAPPTRPASPARETQNQQRELARNAAIDRTLEHAQTRLDLTDRGDWTGAAEAARSEADELALYAGTLTDVAQRQQVQRHVKDLAAQARDLEGLATMRERGQRLNDQERQRQERETQARMQRRQVNLDKASELLAVEQRRYRVELAQRQAAEQQAGQTAPLKPISRLEQLRMEREARRSDSASNAENAALNASERRAEAERRGDLRAVASEWDAEVSALRDRQRVAQSGDEKAQIARALRTALTERTAVNERLKVQLRDEARRANAPTADLPGAQPARLPRPVPQRSESLLGAVENEGGGVPKLPTAPVNFGRLAERAADRALTPEERAGNQSLESFVVNQGGVRRSSNNRGEVDYGVGREGGRPGFVNDSGLPVDEMRRYANEAGYGPYETEADFLGALRDARNVFSERRRMTGQLVDEEEEYYRNRYEQEQQTLGQAKDQPAAATEPATREEAAQQSVKSPTANLLAQAPPRSPYARLIGDNRAAVDRLHELPPGSPEAAQIVAGLREYAQQNGIERKHIGALMDAVKNYQADRGNSRRFQQPAAPQWRRTRVGNSEPLGAAPDAEQFRPGTGTLPNEIYETAAQMTPLSFEARRQFFAKMRPRDLEASIQALEERRNETIRRMDLEDGPRGAIEREIALDLRAANQQRHELVRQGALPARQQSRGGSAPKRVLTREELERFNAALEERDTPRRGLDTGDLARFDSKVAPTAALRPSPTAAAQPAQPSDADSFNRAREEVIRTSREAGNAHLDEIPALVETMRGKEIYYAHDPKVRGVIRTVDNGRNVYVDWSDKYSADKELASATIEKVGRKTKTVYRTTLGPNDLKDYVLAKPTAQPAGEESVASAPRQNPAQAVEQQPRTVTHDDPTINGKPVLAKTSDGRVIVENSANKGGVSVVKDQKPVQGGLFGETESQSAAKPAQPEKWKSIGKNADGVELFEDENGVRSYMRGRIRVTEPVAMIPVRGGGVMPSGPTDARRRNDFKTVEEAGSAQQQPQPQLVAQIEQPKVGDQNPFANREKQWAGRRVMTKEGLGVIEAVQPSSPGSHIPTVKIQLDSGETLDYSERAVMEMLADASKRQEAENPAQTEKPKDVQPERAPAVELSAEIASRLASNEVWRGNKNTGLRALAKEITDRYGVPTLTDREIYEAMEAGVNRFIANASFNLSTDAAGLEAQMTKIRTLVTMLLPTQTVRDGRQIGFQQFSTPPDLALLANWAANIQKGEQYLEPSAGTAGLATWGKVAGAKVTANEIDSKRRELLRAQGFDRITEADANYIHFPQVLGKDYTPTVVVMNPPFSREGAKGGARNLDVGGNHILASLDRLADNGRLVAIVGEGMRSDAPRYRDFFKQVTARGALLRANIGISGKVYQPYGTNFGTRVLVIDKTAGLSTQPDAKAETLAQAAQLLQGVHDDRRLPAAASSAVAQSATRPERESNPAQPTRGADIEQPGRKADSGNAAAQPVRVGSETPKPATAASPDRQSTGNLGTSGRLGTRPSGTVSSIPVADAGTDAGRGNLDSGATGTARTARAGTGGLERDTPKAARPVSELRRRSTGQLAELQRQQATTEAEPEEELPAASAFRPNKAVAKIEGAQPHPAPLVESAALASVELPSTDYIPDLPQRLIDSGRLSDAQLESIVYAGAAHQQTLKNGARRGFFIGDGTGLGKGATIAGIILDNFRQGRKKALWITKNNDLFAPTQRDLDWVGLDSKQYLKKQSDTKAGDTIKLREGVMFTTFGTLQSAERTGEAAKAKTRVQQLIDWLGPDFDGVIAIDEAHHLQNELAQKGKRGTKEASKTALAGKALREALPKARVVYLSATGATEPENLAYLDRLGLWGQGTPFGDAAEFVGAIKTAGLSAMELVAQNLKQMGAYVARSISFEGVTQNTLVHDLTEDQRATYDGLSRAWQTIFRNINGALEETEGDAQAKSAAMSQFWGQQQRFFNQMLVTMQMPSVVKAVRKDLAEGRSVVLQVVSTFEAQLNETLDAQKVIPTQREQTIDEIDLTPREGLKAWLKKAFPVTQYEIVVDADGNKTKQIVKGPDGRPLENPTAVRMRDKMIASLDDLRMPPDPILFLYKEFGVDNVAEITGRGVMVYENKEGDLVVKRRPDSARKQDVIEFQDGRKRLLIFSRAGGTGASYHADMKAKNQQKRVHYLVEAGWQAAEAVQGLGRTHRSNQAQPPHYVLVSTDVKGQKRFISTIARRLEQLGALTRGQRQAGNQSLFSAMDNLEGPYARMALRKVLDDIRANRVEGMSGEDFTEQTGLALEDKEGKPIDIAVPQFLNRLLSMELDKQNAVFDRFETSMLTLITRAQELGTFDQGLEQIKGDNPRIVQEKEVWRDPATGHAVNYVEVAVDRAIERDPFEVVQLRKPERWLRNRKSGTVWAQFKPQDSMNSEGEISRRVLLQSAGGKQTMLATEFRSADYDVLAQDAAKKLYDEQLEALPQSKEFKHSLLTGALLPVWNRLPKANLKAKRAVVGQRRILGMELQPKDVETTLKNFGTAQVEQGEDNLSQMDAARMFDRVMQGAKVKLGNGITLAKREQYGQSYVEFKDWTNARMLLNAGAREVVMGAQRRLYAPDAATLAKVLDALGNPAVADVQGLKTGTGVEYRLSGFDGPAALKWLKKEWGITRASIRDTRAEFSRIRQGEGTGAALKFAGAEALNTGRALMLTGDIPILRQGGMLNFNITRKDFWQGQSLRRLADARAAWSDVTFPEAKRALEDMEMPVLGRPVRIAQLAHLAGVDFTSDLFTHEPDRQRVEEGFESKIGRNLPVMRNLEQFNAVYMDLRRLDVFRRYLDNTLRGRDLTDEQTQKVLADAATMVNLLSGRAEVQHNANGSERLTPTNLLLKTRPLWMSAQYLSSRLRLLNPGTYARLDPKVRQEALRDVAGFAAFAVGAATLAALAGFEVGIDPDDSDFMKIKIGNTRYDFIAGYGPVLRLFWQLGKAGLTTVKTEVRGQSAAAVRRDTVNEGTRFLRGKLGALPSLGVTWWNDWTEITGEKVMPGRAVLSRVTPLLLQDVKQAIDTQDKTALIKLAPALIGAGVQNYQAKRPARAVLTRHPGEMLPRIRPGRPDAPLPKPSPQPARPTRYLPTMPTSR